MKCMRNAHAAIIRAETPSHISGRAVFNQACGTNSDDRPRTITTPRLETAHSSGIRMVGLGEAVMVGLDSLPSYWRATAKAR